MLTLTKKQKQDLHLSILQYIQKHSRAAAQAFSQAFQLPLPQKPDDGPSTLERKWTTIMRLQNRVTQLQKENATLKEDLNSRGVDKRNGTQNLGDQHFLKVPAKLNLKGHRSNVTNIEFHPEYTEVASCSQDGTIKIWDFDTGQLQKTLTGHTGSVNQISYDPAGKFLASCSADCTIKIWDCMNDFFCIKTLFGHDHNVYSIRYSPVGDFLLSASRDKTIRLWDIPSGYINKKTFTGHDDSVKKLAISNLGKVIASCSKDESIIVWHIDKEAPQQQIVKAHENSIESIKLVEGQNCTTLFKESSLLKKRRLELKKDDLEKEILVFTSSRDKTIRLFSANSGECLHIFHGHDNWVTSIAMHSTGKWLYSSADDKTVRVWDTLSGKCLRKVDAHQHFVSCLQLSSKYKVIMTGGADHMLKLWQLA